MKLLTKKEKQGIDSTKATIDKWDAFLKKAVHNLGFQKKLIDGMYPYDTGIPMLDGSRLPVDPVTGRVFFKMSWADKLAGALCGFSNTTGSTEHMCKTICKTILAGSRGNFDTFFPDEVKEQIKDYYNDLFKESLSDIFGEDCSGSKKIENISEINEDLIPDVIGFPATATRVNIDTEYMLRAFWAVIIKNSIVYVSSMNREDTDTGAKNTGFLNDSSMESLGKMILYIMGASRIYIYYKPLEEVFRNSDTVAQNIRGYVHNSGTFRSNYTDMFNRLEKWSEVYFQDYLVISLNPIDKLMLSTKQAFSSCMSIAKQNDAVGTQSTYAYGLPVMFDTDGVFLTFLTPGKHKNMYWETGEWKKDPEDRDKEKAYKYLKMTCRALTYQGTLSREAKGFLTRVLDRVQKTNDISEENKTLIQENIEKLEMDQERLFVGRQYAANGEDNVWQELIEVLMAIKGIATGCAYSQYVSTLRELGKESHSVDRLFRLESSDSGISRFRNKYFARKGEMLRKAPLAIDRFGYLRGFYYDNLSIRVTTEMTTGSSGYARYQQFTSDPEIDPVLKGSEVLITVGSSRSGSGGLCNTPPKKEELDMFKIMTGDQPISYYNMSIRVCLECGRALTAQESTNLKNPDDPASCLCDDCLKKLKYTKCQACGCLYAESEASEHVTVNIRRFTNPNNWEDMAPVEVCIAQLKKAYPVLDTNGWGHRSSGYYLCAHCGKIHKFYNADSYTRSTITTMPIPELGLSDIQVGLCSDCLKSATMCSRCKKLIFIDDVHEAALLLPNKKVVCADCIDNIRMRRERKDVIKEVLDKLTEKEIEEQPHTDAEETMEQAALRTGIENSGSFRNKYAYAQIKDVIKQIKSYLQAHPEVHYPTLKASKKPPEPVVEEVELTSGTVTLDEIADSLERTTA